MSVYTPPSVSFEATTDFGTDGLVGTIGVRIEDNLGNTVLARTTAGIIEAPPNSGLYAVTLTAPANEGQYSIIWDDADDHWSIDDLVVTSDAPITVVGAPASDLGPCTAWLTSDDVAACCSVETTDTSIFDGAVAQAQELLYQKSGRLFAGQCERTVRPCAPLCGCGWQVLSRGHIVSWSGRDWFCSNRPWGCCSLSTVKLAGYPVQEITSVLIDGATVDPATYRLDRHSELVRMRDPADPDTVLTWPGCQNLDLEDTEDGTFSVTYLYGINPPESGIAAAAQLACEIYKQCQGEPCALPSGVTRVSRQGVVLDKAAFARWAYSADAGWKTGMALVDAFLSAFNPTGNIRRPVFWSPAASLQYARPVT